MALRDLSVPLQKPLYRITAGITSQDFEAETVGGLWPGNVVGLGMWGDGLSQTNCTVGLVLPAAATLSILMKVGHMEKSQ